MAAKLISATRALTLATAFAVALVPAAPALAWGDREQGVVTGIAGTLLLQGILRDLEAQNRPRPVPQPYPEPYPTPRPYYPAPQPTPGYHQGNSIWRTPVAEAFQSYSRSERKAIQRQLSRYGYYRGGADGAFGPGTYSAITGYARDSGDGAMLRTTAGSFAVLDGLLY
ncbi:peptidoglycan-binding protein [Paracoccaceae bacterium]